MAAPTPTWVSPVTIVEAPDSRLNEWNERICFTQVLDGTYTACLAGMLNRGTVGTPTGTAGAWIVESSSVKRERGQKARLTIKWQGATVLPPQEAGFTPENLQMPTSRNQMFASLQPEDISLVQRAYDALTAAGQNSSIKAFASSENPDLCKQLFDKLASGHETYYVASVRYSWTSFYAYGSQPALNLGGYVDVPAGPFSSQAIGDGSISWLREADEHRLVSGLFNIVAVTRHWLGGPTGQWDLDLYPN